jgi:HlyD family secretion protein
MKRMLWGVGFLAVGVVAVVAYLRIDANAAAPRLTSSRVTRGSVVEVVSSTGTLQPVDTVEVSTQVSGTIKSLGADFNSTVKQGQVVATLDPALLQSQVEQAQATVVKLRADVEQARVSAKDAQTKLVRAQALSKEQLLAQSDFDVAQTTFDAAQAAIKSAEAQLGQADASLRQNQVNLSHTIIVSPVDGIVLSRAVEIGQTVSASTQAPTLFTIARKLETMQVSASVDEADIGLVQEGQPVTFTVDAYGAQRFTGTVRQVRLQPTTTNNVVNYTTVIDVPNAERKLKPGMTATVSFEVARADDVLRVPAAALRFTPSEEVLVAINGREGAAAAAAAVDAGGIKRSRGVRSGERSTASSGSAQLPSQSQAQTQTQPSIVPAAFKTSAASGNEATSANGATGASGAGADAAASKPMATIWLVVDGRLKPVRVQAGLSDGTHVAVVSNSLEAGAEVATGVASSSAAAAAVTSKSGSSSPLMPSMPRRPGNTGRS